MSDKIRIGAVGLGWVARHRHLPSILRNPLFCLVGVADHHEGRATEVATRHRLPYFSQTERIEDIPWLNEVDALVIGTPPMAHADLVVAALERGKHVITEKPFAMNVIEGETMAEVARRTGKTLAVIHNFQFSRAVQKLEADLDAGKLGKLKRVAAIQLGNPHRRLPSWYESLPFGIFYDESPHFFYLLHRLAHGDLTLRHAHALAGQNGENTPSLVNLLYRGAGSIPVTIDCTFDSSISEWYVRVSGDKATGIVDIFRDIYIRLPNDGEHRPLQILRTSLCAITQHLLQHIPNGLALMFGRMDYGNDEIFARFAKAITTGTQPAGHGFEEALSVLKLQHEAVDALRKNFYP